MPAGILSLWINNKTPNQSLQVGTIMIPFEALKDKPFLFYQYRKETHVTTWVSLSSDEVEACRSGLEKGCETTLSSMDSLDSFLLLLLVLVLLPLSHAKLIVLDLYCHHPAGWVGVHLEYPSL